MQRHELSPQKLALLKRLLNKQGIDSANLPIIPLQRTGARTQVSLAQAQLWVAHRLDPESPAYNVHFSVALPAAVSDAAIDAALQAISARHEILRTTFHEESGTPVQEVHDALPPALTREDLRGLAPEARPATYRRLARGFVLAPFDVERGPLVRALLVRFEADQAALLVTMHHLVTDGWSVGVFVRELRELVAGGPPELPALPVQYADFAAWQCTTAGDTRLGEASAFWKSRLAGLPPLDLPADRRRPAAPTFEGAVESLHVEAVLAGRLRDASRGAGVTLFSTLLAAYDVLLGALAAQDDVVVGVPVANRDRPELQPLIGLFVNTVPVRVTLERSMSFTDLAARVHTSSSESFRFQDVPFDAVVPSLGLKREPGRHAAFQTVFSLLDAGAMLAGTGSSSAPAAAGEQHTTRFDLEAHVLEGADGLRVSFVYRSDVFEAATVKGWLHRYVRVLTAVADAPATPLADLSLFEPGERQQVVAEWNDTRRAFPDDRSLVSLFEACADARPDAVALEDGRERVTYRELDARANQLAHALVRAGVILDEPVGLCLERGSALVVAILGVLKAGGAYLALNATDPPSRIAALLHDAGARIVITAGTLLPAEVSVSRLDPAAAAVESTTRLGRSVPADALAYVSYTSGSTGRPKGVAVPHRAVARLVCSSSFASFGPEESWLQLAPVSFDASTLELWGALLHGSRLVIAPPGVPTPDELGTLLARHRVTSMWLTASLYNAVVDARPAALSGLRQLLIGGEALSVPHVRRGLAALPHTRLVNGYGPTENTTFTCCHAIPPGLSPNVASIPIGVPVTNTQVYVLGEDDVPVPVGVAGELYAGGEGLARGYVGSPRQTAERFVPDGVSGAAGARLYRTGDVVRWTPDGHIVFVGRRDGQIKLRGFRIELGEVTAALQAVAGVGSAVAVVRTDVRGDGDVKRLAAYVSPAPGATVEAQQVRAALQSSLPAYMVPSSLIVLERLPLTSSGKVDVQSLPAPSDDALDDATQVAPRTPVEHTLARIWSDVLHRPAVSVLDDFFDLGGDSILGLQIVSRSVEAGVPLKPRHLFEHPTIAGLAAVAAAATQPAVAPATAAVTAETPITGTAPLTPIQRWFLDADPVDAHHFNQALFLRISADTSLALVAQAVEQLARHHDALRSRFRRTPAGWVQEIGAPGLDPVCTQIDLSALAPDDQDAAMRRACDEAHAGFDLERGPLFRGVIFARGAREARLLLVAHHLVVDGVSWRLLADDLRSTCDQLARGETPRLPAKTTSVLEWGRAVAAWAASPPADEHAYWSAIAAQATAPAPAPGRSAARVRTSLDPDATAALLQRAPRAFDARITELLLSALVEAFGRGPDAAPLRVDLESHGRQEFVSGVDVSRTAGWFTAIYPVVLPSSRVPLDVVKRTLRGVPHDGIGYGALRYCAAETVRAAVGANAAADPPISFNYLGQFDQLFPPGDRFAVADEPSGLAVSPRQARRHDVDVVAFVHDGALHVDWVYDDGRHAASDMDALAARYLSALRAFVSRAGQPASPAAQAVRIDGALDATLEARLRAAYTQYVDAFSVTPMQHGMLFHTLLHPDDAAYTEVFTCRLQGAMRLDVFRAAWDAVIARHDVLRSVFVHADVSVPVQVVLRTLEPRWQVLDWTGVAAAEQEQRLAALVLAEERSRFDLATGPLLQFTVVRLDERHTQFVWSFHHALLDGWSLAVVLGELGELYDAQLAKRAPRLAPVRPYREYVQWLGAQDRGAASAFWAAALEGAALPTPLGIDRRAVRAARASESREHTIRFSARTSAALTAAARAQKVTVNTLLLGTWALLLARFSGRSDVVFGMTVAGRPADLPGSESRLGLFINTVPVRVQIPPHASAGALLAALHESQLAQREYEHLALVDVARAAGLATDAAMFDSILVFENYPLERAEGGTTRSLVASHAEGRHRSNFPLVLVGSPGDRITLRAIYDGNRLDDAVVAQLLERFERVAAAISVAPERPLHELAIAGDDELLTVVSRWNSTVRHCPPSSIPSLFEARASAHPDAVAVVAADATLTYGDLNRRANALAHALRRRGLGLDDRVGVCMDRGADLAVALVGILKAGAAYVAVDAAEPPLRRARQLADAGVRVVVAGEAVTAAFGDCAVLRLSDVAGELDSNPGVDIPPEALAYVAFTSGSTGRPKGVEVPHRAVVRLLFGQRFIELGASEVVLQLAPVNFDASTLEIWGALLHGGRLACYPGRVPEPSELGAFLREAGVTTAWLTASLFNTVFDRAPEALGSVRQLLIGGEALSVPHVRAALKALPATAIVNGYGPTENTTFTCCHVIPRVLDERVASIPLGGPIVNTQAYVLDADGQPVPPGVPGELFAGGAGLARGYAGSPRLTAERFVPDATSGAAGARLYRTGDVVRWLDDGTLEFLGRRDGQIKLRGFRVELGEVETALGAVPGVVAAAAVIRGTGDARRLVGYVAPAPATTLQGSDVRAAVQESLPPYMVPSGVVVLDQLPLTASGKIDRRLLPDPDDAAAASAFVEPRSATEARVAAIWAEVLGLERVGVFDNFFERGGHSLLATQLVVRLREAFGRPLPLVALFDAPTVAGLAALLDAATTAPFEYPPIDRAPRGQALRLSSAQQRLWFLDRLNPGSTAYNVPAALRLDGDLDEAALERALGEIVRRHEVLRTAFKDVDGRAAQVVEPWSPFAARRIDLRDTPAAGREAAIATLMTTEAQTPFDLSRAPFVRATIVRCAPRQHVLLLTLHHIACDAWSLATFVRELMAFYQGGDAAARVPDLPAQFADFAQWQWHLSQHGRWASQLEYWKGVLADVPALELPTDRPRPAAQTFNGSHVVRPLPGEAVERLRALGQGEGATAFMVMLAAFDVLLWRYSGQRDVAVGTPISYRPRPELEPLIGFFSNTLVVRARTAGCATFREWLRVVRDAAREAYAHQDVAFEQVVEAVQPDRRLDRNPLFQVLFTLHQPAVDPLELPGLRIEPLEIERMSVRLDLEVHVGEGGGGPLAAFYFNTDLFDATTIARMADAFGAIVAAVAAQPDRPLVEIDLRPGDERRRIERWNDTGRPSEATALHRVVERQVRRTPHAVAVELNGVAFDYTELNARANQLARALRAQGVQADDRVAIAVERSLDMPVCILGVMKAGAAYLPLDLAYPADRLAYMLTNSGARVLLTQEHVAATFGPGLREVSVPTLLVDRDWPAIAALDRANLENEVDPDTLAYVLYTSGSTGRPKGVALAHRPLVNLLEWQLEVSGPAASGRTIQYAPLSFDPSFLEMFSAWASGGTLVLLEEELRRDFLALVRHLDRERIGRIYITPAALHQLADASDTLGVTPRALREINAAGERLEITPQIARMCARIGDCVVFNQYGPTESHVVTAERLAGQVEEWPVLPSIGPALPNTRMHLLDAAGEPQPIGVAGELFIAGECLARGYVNNPRLTAERFLPDPWPTTPGSRLYRTGDLAWLRADGAIEYLGRTDHQVKLRGYRIELGEIESVLTQHPGVLDAVAAVRESAAGGRHLAAYIVARGTTMPSPDVLRAHVAAALPEYMVPALFQRIDGVPLTPSGKVDRASLPALDDTSWPDEAFVAPTTAIEHAVAAIWSDTLGVPRVGVHDNFFTLGGHSLLAAQVVSRARREWGVEVPIRVLFEQPTVAAFADRVQTLVWASKGQALAGTLADREEGVL